jgi:hypothetical protein
MDERKASGQLELHEQIADEQLQAAAAEIAAALVVLDAKCCLYCLTSIL